MPNRRTPTRTRDVLGQAARRVVHVEREVVQVRDPPRSTAAGSRCGPRARRRRSSCPTPAMPGVHRCRRRPGRRARAPSPRRGRRRRRSPRGRPRRARSGRRYRTTSRNRPENRKKSWSSIHDPALHRTTCATMTFSPVDQGVGEVELRRREASPSRSPRRRRSARRRRRSPRRGSSRSAARRRSSGCSRVNVRTVRRDGVVPLRNLPRLELLVAVPRVLHVGVLRTVVAVQLDVGRHRRRRPSRSRRRPAARSRRRRRPGSSRSATSTAR